MIYSTTEFLDKIPGEAGTIAWSGTDFELVIQDTVALIEEANQILIMADRPRNITSARQAILEVENLLQDLDAYVEAVVLSDPPGCEVIYRRVIHGPSPTDPSVTTNVTIRVHAALYEMRCEEKTLFVPCASGCTVHFRRTRTQ